MAEIVGNVSRKRTQEREDPSRERIKRGQPVAGWGRKELQNRCFLAGSRAVRLRTPGLRQGFFGAGQGGDWKVTATGVRGTQWNGVP